MYGRNLLDVVKLISDEFWKAAEYMTPVCYTRKSFCVLAFLE